MAAGDAKRIIRNAPYRLHFHLYDVTTGAGVTGDAANLDGEVSLDSGAYTNITAAEAEVGNGGYYVDLTAAEMTGSSIVVAVKSTTSNVFEPVIELKPEPCVDSGVAQASTTADIVLRSGASSTNDFYNGLEVEIVRGTNAGQARRIIDYVGSSRTALVDRAWTAAPSTDSVYVVHPRTGPALTDMTAVPTVVAQSDLRTVMGDTTNYAAIGTGLAYFCRSILTGQLQGGTPTTSTFVTDINDNVSFQYSSLTFVNGNLRGKTVQIATHNDSTGSVTVYPELSDAPAGTELFIVTGLFV